MFELPVLQVSTTVRTGPAQWFAEAVATFGLVLTILGCLRQDARRHSLRGRPLHHGGLLVHGLDLVRQSRGDARALAVRHVRRHRARRRAGVHRGAADRHGRRGAPFGLAVAGTGKSGHRHFLIRALWAY